MSYILFEQRYFDRRADLKGMPWHVYVVASVQPDKVPVDLSFLLDPETWPDPRAYPMPNIVSYVKMLPHRAKGQLRRHYVNYNFIVPQGVATTCRLKQR